MGKPYEVELSHLKDAFDWAELAQIDGLSDFVRCSARRPLIAIGSGGSLTTAHMAVQLHQWSTGKLATAMTPMEIVSAGLDLREMSVILLTAGGRNPDVTAVFRRVVQEEPSSFGVLCMSSGTPLAKLATNFPFVTFCEHKPPTGKDGFLATNTLIASAVLLLRASCSVHRPVPNLRRIVPVSAERTLSSIDRRCRVLWERSTLVVLHGPETKPATVDLESKFTEAALGNVRFADYRHFAHGRHHWLAKHAETSAILALTTPHDRDIAERTLATIPKAIPVLREEINYSGPSAALAALVRVFFIVASAGRARAIDPGRPKVPPFGRRIYHLRPSPNSKKPTKALVADLAIQRKTEKSIAALERSGHLHIWQDAYSTFMREIKKARYSAVVLDYDGTLCGESNRFEPLIPSVVGELRRLLAAGLLVGIATGRGKSVRGRLREAVPRKYWKSIVVGYYNGGDVASLDRDDRPDGTEKCGESLLGIAEAINQHTLLCQLAKFEPRLPQITATPADSFSADTVWELLIQIVRSADVPHVTVLRSSHSIDVIAPQVSKTAVVDEIYGQLGQKSSAEVLCIGDRGKWPGNDFSLLNHPFSLSCDQVSPDPHSCWNIAPVGVRGVDATLDYLQRLEQSATGIRFRTAPRGAQRK